MPSANCRRCRRGASSRDATKTCGDGGRHADDGHLRECAPVTPEYGGRRALPQDTLEPVALLPRRYEVTLLDEVTGRSFQEVMWARSPAGAVRRAASWIDAKEKIALYDAPAQVRRVSRYRSRHA